MKSTNILRIGLMSVASSALVLALVPLSPDTVHANYKAAVTEHTFVEAFSTTTYKDAANTTADWNTTSNTLMLASGAGAYFEANKSTEGTGAVTTNGNFLKEYVDIALDASDNPIIVWQEHNDTADTYDIFLVRWNGSAWVGYTGTDPDLIAHTDGGTHLLADPRIAVNSSGNPSVAWVDIAAPGDGDIMVSRWNGSAWVGYGGASPDNVSSDVNHSVEPDIVIDPSNNPIVTWSDTDPGVEADILVARWTGSAWEGFAGASPDNLSNDTGVIHTSPSIAVDGSGDPAVAWYDFTTAPNDVYAAHWTGSAWEGYAGASPDNVSSNASDSQVPRLALDPSSGNPIIAWNDNATGDDDVTVVRWNGSAYVGFAGAAPDNVSGTSVDSFVGGLEVRTAGMPAVTWQDPTSGNFEVYVAHWNGSAWVGFEGTPPDNVSNDSDESVIPAMALDSLGNPAVTWVSLVFPFTSDIAYFSRYFVPFEPSVAQSTNVNATQDEVISAELTADVTLNGGSVDFFLTNDGGTNFTATAATDFTTSGSDLRWKANLAPNPSDLSKGPVINSVTITYRTRSALTRFDEDDPVALSILISQEHYSDGAADAVVLARNDNMSDAFTVTPYASLKNASLLLTPSGSLPSDVLTELQRVLGSTSKTVYLAGGSVALAPQIETDLAAAGFTSIERFPGTHRRETSRLVANAIMDDNPAAVDSAFVSEDQAFVDSLSVSSIAGHKVSGAVRPILLTNRGNTSPDPSVLTFLSEHTGVTALEIIGGPVAVPYEVGPSIQQSQPQVADVTRSEGADRYETNAVLNTKHYTDPTAIVLANGQSSAIPGAQSISVTGFSGGLFAALLAGNFAASQSAPLLLTLPDRIPDPVATYLSDNAASITQAFLVGSLDLISQAVEDSIAALL